jgi:arginine deiminase
VRVVRKNNSWNQLRTVMLGSYPGSEHFRHIESAQIREPLMRIADEINHDLDHFQTMLQSHGCEVLRPPVMPVEDFRHLTEVNQRLPEPPLQVRNSHAVIYDTLLRVGDSPDEVQHLLANLFDIQDVRSSLLRCHDEAEAVNRNCQNNDTGAWYRRSKYLELAGPEWPDFYHYVQGHRSQDPEIFEEMQQFHQVLQYEAKEWGVLDAPNLLVMPDRLIIDCNEYSRYDTVFAPWVPVDSNIGYINTTAGHTDGCFVVIGNDTILGVEDVIDFTQAFPGYTLIPVPASIYGDIMHWHGTNRACPRWWIDGQDNNQEIQHFIATYMDDYIGHAYETLFDVNVLSLDNDCIFISNDNKLIRQQLSKRGIETILVPWRHQFFVDGGLHCITLDLNRKDV